VTVVYLTLFSRDGKVRAIGSCEVSLWKANAKDIQEGAKLLGFKVAIDTKERGSGAVEKLRSIEDVEAWIARTATGP
jgi:hypothetical protein